MRDVNAYVNRIRRSLGLPNLKNPFVDLFSIPLLVLQLSTPIFEYPRRDLPDNINFMDMDQQPGIEGAF